MYITFNDIWPPELLKLDISTYVMELTSFCSIVLLSELSILVAIVFAVLKNVNLLQHYEITQLYPDASL
jgi:hypothetical protein